MPRKDDRLPRVPPAGFNTPPRVTAVEGAALLAALSWVLGCGGQAKIVGPPQLRERLAERVCVLRSMYEYRAHHHVAIRLASK